MRDLLYAARALRRTPGFTAVAVLTLALGIGANTAVFSVAWAALFRPLPFRDPARLVAVWDTYLPQYPKIGASAAEISAWRESGVFEQTAWYREVPRNSILAIPGSDPTDIRATFIDPGLLPLLGAAPMLGRAFAAGEPPASVLLSESLWRTRFGADPAIAGRTVRIGDQPFTVEGVMRAAFRFPDWADVWLPPGPLQGDEMSNPVRHAAGFVARLKRGVTLAQAASRLEQTGPALTAAHPKTSTGWGVRASGLQEDLTGDRRPTLLLLLGAATLVLLIACGNIANLLIARAGGRMRETAVRRALGASWWRLAGQSLAESLVLAVCGGVLGLLAAAIAVRIAAPEAAVDAVSLLFVFVISIFAATAGGLIPAAAGGTRGDLNARLKAGAQPGGGAGRLRRAVIVLEFALALMLAAGAGILMKSFVRLMRVDPGLRSEGVLALRLSVPASGDAAILWKRLEAGLRAIPGVERWASTNTLPPIASRAPATRFYVPGAPGMNPDALPAAQIRLASTAFFDVMGIPLRAGRTFTESDLNQPVVIVNQAMARRYWPGKDAVGMKFVTGPWGPNPSYSTIVGVVGDVKQFGLDSETTMDLYFPGRLASELVVKTTGNPAALASAVRRAVREAAPAIPVAEVRTMDAVLAESARSRRWTMSLVSLFAAVALLLALVGIYGVMAGSVAARRREIGIRMALGAGRSQVVAMVLREGIALCTIGMAIGVWGALFLRRVMAGLVFGVSPSDPLVYGSVAAFMLAVSAAACYLPARRASTVDPLVALRWE
jgi:putative ABC transport system permease protein